MKQLSWRTKAKTVFGKKATLNIGDGSDGQFAVVARCMRQVDYSLWATRADAEKKKSLFDRVGCCGECQQRMGHSIVDLGEVK